MGSSRKQYNIFDQSLTLIFTGTEREIVSHFGLDKLRARWAINHTVELDSKYIIDTNVDDPMKLLSDLEYKRGSYI